MDFNLSNYHSKSNKKNKRSTIDLANVVYDEEFVSLINSLSTSIKNYYSLTLSILRDLYNNSISIDNNLIYSKCLINEINYNTKEKIKQLEEKIDSISNTKKIFEKNILLIHSNLNKFFNDSKLIFKNLKNIRNSKINFAIDSNKKVEKYGTNNSMINFKTAFEKNDLLINPKEKENDLYFKNINNSLTKDKSLSLINCKRNKIFQMRGNSTENNRRHKLKSIYFNNNFTINGSNIHNNDSFRIKNKVIKKIKKRKGSQDNTVMYRQKLNNIKIGNLNHIIEFTPEITKSKSSYNNFYINQNSNINLNSNNINNINNNNLELSYKVIEFLSLLTNITKNNSKKNPNMQKMIQNFEKTKKNLFELSKKYIEHNNLNESKIYSGKSSSNSTNENAKNNKISKNEMQLILMNNNIENIKKGIEYKELIEKINYLSSNINKLEKQNKQLSKINDSTKKELINNTLLLSKKNSQLNLLNKEKAQFISTINVLKKDNESLMELIQEKKVNSEKEIKKKENPNTNTNIKEINLIKQKDKIINDLRKKINELDKKFLDRNNETKNLNNKIKELNDSIKYYKNVINDKQNLIQQLQIENQNKIKNSNNEIMDLQIIKNSFNKKDLIFEQIEELAILGIPTKIPKYNLNISKVSSFNFLHKKIQINGIKEINNSPELVELENKINELNTKLEKKENDIKKYKNENSILKNLAKSKKNKEENDETDLHQLEEEISKLKSENSNIISEKKILEEKIENLITDNKNKDQQLITKNSELKNLENTIKELEEQLKEAQINNIEKIYNEQEINSNKKDEEEIKEKNNDSRNIKNIIEADTDKNNEIINQLKEELKEKENIIEYLKIENQELKSKMEENDDNNFMDSSLKNSELNDKYNTALEEKVKFLSERNEYYQKLYDEDKIKLQNLENIINKLKIENEELKKNKINKEENDEVKSESKNTENNIENISENKEKEENEEKIYSLKNYNILCDKAYGELRWFLLVNKVDSLVKETDKLNYDDLIWVPKINIIDIDDYKEIIQNIKENKKEDTEKLTSNKIYKNEIHINREKEISFSNNFSFNNNSEELNKNKQNSHNNSNSLKRGGSFYSLGNNTNIINEDNNSDYNKLMEKYKMTLEKLNKTEEKYTKLQKKNAELKDKILKINKSGTQKITISDDSNNFSNCNDIGKLSIIDNNFEGDGDVISKLNNQKEREQEYFEQLNIEIEANKNQLKVVKEIFKELEKKFETVKKISENLFSKITLKRQEKEEFKVLLKVMDFSDEQIALIIDKRKK